MSKTYTAQEMRYAAQCLHYNSPTKLTIEAATMLRQAAEMRERCEKIQKHFAMTKTEREMIDYILRGDAEKEARSENA